MTFRREPPPDIATPGVGRKLGGARYNVMCPSLRALFDPKDEKFFSKKTRKSKTRKSLCSLSIFHPWHSLLAAPHLMQSHSVRGPVFGGDGSVKNEGRVSSLRRKRFLSPEECTPKSHANGQWPSGQRKQKGGFNAFPSASRLSNLNLAPAKSTRNGLVSVVKLGAKNRRSRFAQTGSRLPPIIRFIGTNPHTPNPEWVGVPAAEAPPCFERRVIV